MNRRSFLSFFALAPIAAVTAGAASADPVTIIGIDGGADDVLGVSVINARDLTCISSRRFEPDEIARVYRAVHRVRWLPEARS